MSWRLSDYFPAFQHRNFRLFAPGQFISLIGFWMQSVGQGWLVYRLTYSSAYLGAIAFAQQIPVLLLALPAGGIVDRTDRHRLVIFTQSLAFLQAASLAFLTYSENISLAHLFALATLLGVISALDLPARQTFLVQMVGKEHLMNAIAVNSSMFNAARMIGPAIAGIVVAKWGEAFCFLLNAVSYLAVIVSLLMMSIKKQDNGIRQSWREDLAEGFRFVKETQPIRVMLQLLGAFGITGFSYVVLLPIFADAVFSRGAKGLGWLMTATGMGALSGALFLAARKDLRGLTKIISIAAFGFPLSLMLFGFSPFFWVSFSLLCWVGFFMMLTVASVNTAIQSIVPDSLRGRVMSFFTTMLIGTIPIGSLVSGVVAKYLGAQITVFVFALICLIAAIWFYHSLPKIQPEARRLYLLQNPDLQT